MAFARLLSLRYRCCSPATVGLPWRLLSGAVPPNDSHRPFSSSSAAHSLEFLDRRPPTLSSAQSSPPANPKDTLSARMSFLFDQIDAIHRDRSEKDEALQRIRAWRQSKQQQQQQEQLDGSDSGATSVEAKHDAVVDRIHERKEVTEAGNVFRKEVELVHPWPEWIELMERLLQQNYFDQRRLDEDRILEGASAGLCPSLDGNNLGLELMNNFAAVRAACENFGQDRFDILRSLSRRDIEILVGNGCPSTDSKVVYSAKLLRKYVHLNEGDVCSACSLRSSCGRGFLLVPKENEARSLDVMRVLLTFAFDSVNESVKNKPLMKMKSLKIAIRKLLHEVVKLSAVPIDPNLPRPVVKKPPPKIKQPPPTPKRRVGRDDIEMKKGDWLCAKCDFMNFAKNVVCLQCDAKRPKRQLLPGEWECPQCNFLNYRRNMTCFHCECKRPPDEFMENQLRTNQHDSQAAPLKNTRFADVSDAWNFNFDDNESDGADVASFEYADTPIRGECSKLDNSSSQKTVKGVHSHLTKNAELTKCHDRRGYFSGSDNESSHLNTSRTGFDDFDDDDDVDCYEIDTPSNNRANDTRKVDFSEFDKSSDSDVDNYDKNPRTGSTSDSCLSESDDSMQGSHFEDDSSMHAHQRSGTAAHFDHRKRLYADDGNRDFSFNQKKRFHEVSGKNFSVRGRRETESHDRHGRMQASFGTDNDWPSNGSNRKSRGSHSTDFRDCLSNRQGDSHHSGRQLRGSRFEFDNYRKDGRFGNDNSGAQRNSRGGEMLNFGRTRRRNDFQNSENKQSQRFNSHPTEFEDRPRRRRIIER